MYPMPGQPDLALCEQIDRGCVPIIRRMHANGVKLQREHLWDLSKRLTIMMDDTRKEIVSYVPAEALDQFTAESINIDSPDQIAALMFKYLGIGKGKQLKMTASGNRIATGKKQLDAIKNDHPIVAKILQRREYAKLKSTYSDKLPKVAVQNSHTGDWEVFTQFGMSFTTTGRLNSKSPNLQNVPFRTELGQEIRHAFVPREGRVFVSADYSQIELRLLAHCAKERRMIDIFLNPKGDIHITTACSAFHVDPAVFDKVTHFMERLVAKTLNFGICLSHGQKVLTDKGLIPIEKLTSSMLVWDGVEYVKHGGVICNGYQRVITYDGITATPSHKVWTREGCILSLSEAMAKGSRLVTTACEDNPIRYLEDHFQQDKLHIHVEHVEEGLPGIPFEQVPYAQTISSGSELAGCVEESSKGSVYTKVYDIVNCGPRRRYTIEGKLVSNCYDMSAKGLQQTLAVAGVSKSEEECQQFIDAWFNEYPDVLVFKETQYYHARRYGFVWTPWGFLRLVPEAQSVHKRIVAAGMRQAGNLRIQGGAAQILKIGMADVETLCEEIRLGLLGRPVIIEPLLTIHDQLIFETEPEYADVCKALIEDTMASCVKLRVPLKVDVGIQTKWEK